MGNTLTPQNMSDAEGGGKRAAEGEEGATRVKKIKINPPKKQDDDAEDNAPVGGVEPSGWVLWRRGLWRKRAG